MFSRSLALRVAKPTAHAGPKAVRAVVPMMQIYNLQADPALGSLTRISAESRGVRLAVIPQLGAPNTDPQDQTPQFEYSRRLVSTFSPSESAALLAVIEGKLPSFTIVNDFRNLSFAPKVEGSLKAFTFSGTIGRSDGEKGAINLDVEKATLASFRYFIESAIDEGFGFNQYFNPPRKEVIRKYEQEKRAAERQREYEDRQRNRNNNNSGNNATSRNNNNNNNRNNNNNKNGNNNNNNNNRNRNNNRNNNNRNNNNNNKKNEGNKSTEPAANETAKSE